MAKSSEKPIERTGPTLLAALLCDQVLKEKNGRLTLVRLLEEVKVSGEGDNPAGQMPHVKIPLRGVVSLNAAGNPGVYRMALKVTLPDEGARLRVRTRSQPKHDFVTLNIILKGELAAKVPGVPQYHPTSTSRKERRAS